jgi:hypothetical protein
VKKSVPRDTAVFEVREALGQPGCPVCRLAVRSVGRLLQSIAYEQVNDPGLRHQLRIERGFCNQHAYRWLREAHNILGTAIIYREVLVTALHALEGDAAANGKRVGLLRAFRAPEDGDDTRRGLCPRARCSEKPKNAISQRCLPLWNQIRTPSVRSRVLEACAIGILRPRFDAVGRRSGAFSNRQSGERLR